MNIAIIGAGNVGGALAGSSVRAGHTVTLSAKDPAHADAKAKETGARAVRSAADAVKAADVVILAVPYPAVDSVLDELGDALAGKVLIDVTNRLKMEAMAGLRRRNVGGRADSEEGAEGEGREGVQLRVRIEAGRSKGGWSVHRRVRRGRRR